MEEVQVSYRQLHILNSDYSMHEEESLHRDMFWTFFGIQWSQGDSAYTKLQGETTRSCTTLEVTVSNIPSARNAADCNNHVECKP